MYANDHNPPHFHIVGFDGGDVQVRLGALTVINGSVDRRALKEAVDRARSNASYLEEARNEFRST